MAVLGAHFDVLADFETGATRHNGVCQYYVGIHVVQPHERGFGVADRHYFVTFVGQDALAHPLGVRAIIHQQNAAHCLAAGCAGGVAAGGCWG